MMQVLRKDEKKIAQDGKGLRNQNGEHLVNIYDLNNPETPVKFPIGCDCSNNSVFPLKLQMTCV